VPEEDEQGRAGELPDEPAVLRGRGGDGGSGGARGGNTGAEGSATGVEEGARHRGGRGRRAVGIGCSFIIASAWALARESAPVSGRSKIFSDSKSNPQPNKSNFLKFALSIPHLAR
jgi:hypothetical protein